MRRLPMAVTALFVAGVVTVDIGALAVYRYLLVSDILLIAAVGLQYTVSTPVLYVPWRIMAAFALYLGASAVAFARPVDPAAGAFTWLHSAFVMLVYVPAVTSLMTLRPDLRRMVVPAVLISTTVQALLIVNAVAGGLNWTTGTRIAGAFGGVNVWIYAAAVVAAVAWLARGTWLQRLFAVACIVPLIAAEGFLRSRMLWIATVAGAGLFLVLDTRRKTVAMSLVAAGLAVLGMSYVLGALPDAVQIRIADALQPSQATDLQARIAVASAALHSIADSPLVGVGTAQSPQYFEALAVPPVVVNAHNIVLHAAMEGGIVAGLGLCLLPIALAAAWWEANRRHVPADRTTLNWAFATVASIYLAAQLTPTLFEHSFYLIVACLAACSTGSERHPVVLRHDDQARSRPTGPGAVELRAPHTP